MADERTTAESDERRMETIFTRIYDSNKWKGSESGSGPGSAVRRTEPLRERLASLFGRYSVRTLLDVPCGDFNWMRHMDLDVDRYIGMDVVPEVIRDNKSAYSDEVRHFGVADVTADPLPMVDLVLCRDCLVHFTEDEVTAAVNNIKASRSTYLLTTTFHSLEENLPGSTGGWRPINLEGSPFGFPAPIEYLPETEYDPDRPYSDKSLGLWRLEDVPDRLQP
jgi:hypothetical protein